MQSILESFLSACREHPDTTFLYGANGVSVSYGEAASRVYDGVLKLNARGLMPGDRVIALIEDTIPCALSLLACGFARTPIVAVSPLFSSDYLASLSVLASARAIITTGPNIDLANEVNDNKLELLRTDEALLVPSLSDKAFDGLEGEESLVLVADAPVEKAIEALEAIGCPGLAAPFLIQTTGGSTGTPKLVIRHQQAFARYAHFVGDEVAKANLGKMRVLAVNALTHAFAGHMFAMALRFGATLVAPSELDFRASLAEIRELAPNVLPMTPRVLTALTRQWERLGLGEPFLPASAKLVLSAGGRANPQCVELVQHQGVEFVEFYGSSEASLIAVTPYGDYQAGCAGKAPTDVELKRNRAGELLVRSPGLMLGYFGNHELTDLIFDDDGFFRTGDIAEITDDGRVRVLGRKREVINTVEGTNVFPERIETLIESIPNFDQAILVGNGKPYLTAHIVLRSSDGLKLGDRGHLDPEKNNASYEQAGALLEIINKKIEVIEGIIAFSLYGTRFPADVYQPLSSGKCFKDRRQFCTYFSAWVDKLYRLPQASLHLVPPGERRLARRTNDSPDGERERTRPGLQRRH